MPAMPVSDIPHQCDDLHSMGGMSVMGESMAAMTNHMCITPLRPRQPGDEEKVKAVVAQGQGSHREIQGLQEGVGRRIRASRTRRLSSLSIHFTNDANERLADTLFDPTKPSALLYYQTPTQRYKLEGVMFTASPSATEDELNQRIPFSIVRWHEHTKFCAAPADKVKEYFGGPPKIRHVRFDPYKGGMSGRRAASLCPSSYLDDSRLSLRRAI